MYMWIGLNKFCMRTTSAESRCPNDADCRTFYDESSRTYHLNLFAILAIVLFIGILLGLTSMGLHTVSITFMTEGKLSWAA